MQATPRTKGVQFGFLSLVVNERLAILPSMAMTHAMVSCFGISAQKVPSFLTNQV